MGREAGRYRKSFCWLLAMVPPSELCDGVAGHKVPPSSVVPAAVATAATAEPASAVAAVAAAVVASTALLTAAIARLPPRAAAVTAGLAAIQPEHAQHGDGDNQHDDRYEPKHDPLHDSRLLS